MAGFMDYLGGGSAPAQPAAPPNPQPSAAVTQPQPSMITDLAGRAAAVQPSAAVDPRFSPTTAPTLADPTASPFSKWFAGVNASVDQTSAYNHLDTPPSPFEHLTNFFSRQDPSAPTLDQRAQTAAFYARPDVKAKILSNRDFYDAANQDPAGFAAKMEPLMNHVAGTAAPPTVTASGKQILDPVGNQGRADHAGVHPDVAHMFHEPHQYSEDEFVKAAQGLSWNQAQKLSTFQHYIPPQQQIMTKYMSDVTGAADAATKRYEAMVAQGSRATPEQINQAKMDAQTARSVAATTAAKLSLGMSYMYPNMSGYMGQ